MSNFTINTDKTKAMIKDAIFCYVKMQSGDFKYQSTTEKEFSVNCIVDKKTAKAFKKEFPKNGYKEVDTTEFEQKFKIAAPFMDEDEQYIIKLKANATMKANVESAGVQSGDDVPYAWTSRPKVFVPFESGVKDVTMEKLISNGSKGDAAIAIIQNDFGIFPQLSGVLVSDLIEYTKADAGSDFGEIVGGLNPGDGNPEQVPTEHEQEVTTEPETHDDDIPF